MLLQLRLQLEAVHHPLRPGLGQHARYIGIVQRLRTSKALGRYAGVVRSELRLTSGSFSATFHASSHAYQRSVRVCFILACVCRTYGALGVSGDVLRLR